MKGLPMQDRVAQRRALLLVAALEAFGTRGFHAVTVREICAGAGLTERYFYESFKSLEALFSALYLQLNGQLKQATLAALIAANTNSSTSDSSGRIDVLAGAALRVLLEFIRDDPRRARVMLIDAISISHDVQQISGQITREYMELTRRFIDQLFPDAASRGVDLDLIASGLLGSNIHIATHWVREGLKTPFDVVLRNCLAIYQALGAYWPKLAASTTPDKPTPAA
ncbi:TetR/AcrR family transcriptional regulator [Nevskia ramosa]|uniref:TetR/AcrR family transcriptional regulator n=1 Tax=Nevskia ramosa TaxID=64002 RepID=UPI0003B70248|nr:TetR/AcrR family transcriptional regulator [Nevskia ramosa]